MKVKLFKFLALCCFFLIGTTSAFAQPECECDFEGDQVCVVTPEGDTIPFPNACWAECLGFGEDTFVECPEFEWPEEDDCDCEVDESEEWVCVLTATDVICPFPNLCFAECAGYTEADLVECDDSWEPPNPDCVCTADWDPVCVTTDDAFVILFPNACWAECEGYTEADFFECDVDEPGEPDDCDCEIVEGDEWICVLTADGIICPFPNLCFAECAGYTEADVVECDVDWEPPVECECPDEFDPVCAIDPLTGDVIPFPNACWAECFGFDVEDLTECEIEEPNDCDCEIVEGEEWICVLTAEGVICPFPNLCFAACEGYTEADVVECDQEWEPPIDCECTIDFNPVCVVDTLTGDTIPFPNACWAECFGFGEEDFVDCPEFEEPGCGCDAEFDPVCVVLDDGTELFFSNACLAACEGYTEEDYGDCETDEEPNPCNCDFEGEEVCILVEDLSVTFPNLCWAECLGFTEEDVVDCEEFTGDDEIEIEPILLAIFGLDGNSGLTGDDVAGLVENAIEDAKTSTEVVVGIYPNPVSGDELTLEISLPEASEAELSISSLTGKVVNVIQRNLDKGNQKVQINTADLANGVYLLSVKTANHSETLKFIKL